MALKITNIDKSKETEGVWEDYCGVSLKIARQNNPNFLKFLKDAAKKQGRRPFHKLPKRKQSEILKEAIAETILVDWEDLIIQKEEIPYTPENALELINNDEECLNFITDVSMKMDNYIQEAEEEVGEE